MWCSPLTRADAIVAVEIQREVRELVRTVGRKAGEAPLWPSVETRVRSCIEASAGATSRATRNETPVLFHCTAHNLS
jgi:hypothetical protein